MYIKFSHIVVYIEFQSYEDIPGISGRWRFTCTLNFSQMEVYIEFQSYGYILGISGRWRRFT